jgi:hypothetical protein
MVEHLENCDFVKIIEKLENYPASVIDLTGITFLDGDKIYPSLNFIYCPLCGVRLCNECYR